MRYAQQTQVSSQRSRAAIESLLMQHGAGEFAYGWSEAGDRIQFRLSNQVVRFFLRRPDPQACATSPAGRSRSPAARDQALAQAERQRWRALFLVIRAKLEAVESGIAVFEEEFLAFLVLPNQRTVGEVVLPQLADSRRTKLLVAAPDAEGR